eukprot:CAMPEP_0182876754 /NCGR_PEP_ID=MMETSP0034_2-20130328/14327_1 /TAXON_ID=156128 /ORGANISM="Nephroselmis pyriformis, Strain CCMP717" /LENGTH=1384 /DNA_ID=CAMNT_0025009559 /DNA_START=143 /DNA_END=4294 /DNA_ORIENTATION=-
MPIPPAQRTDVPAAGISQLYTKELFKEHEGPRKIKSISFGLMSAQEIVKSAEFHVFERNLYQMPQRIPLPNGILDPRLGTSDKKGECQTCKGKLTDCAGHYGYIKLELPVFHIGYFKNVVSILQCICKTCARVLLPEEERRGYLRRFRNPRMEILQRRALYKKLADRCKRNKRCPRCGANQGVVKKAGSTLKIVHDKYAKNPPLMEAFQKEFDEAVKHNEGLRANLGKVQDDLNPIRVLGLFERILQEDCEVLDLSGRPEHLLMTHLPVPPVCIRPSVEMESAAGSNEDDITMKLMQIIEVNNILRDTMERGVATIVNLMENWDFLQVSCAMYINSELPGLPLAFQGPGKPLRGFVQRLKGKQGRFRGNLSGKRVDFSGRTVISPDPNLRVDEVCVPRQVATTLTYPDRVSQYNIEKLRGCVINGMGAHPGANFVVFPDGGKWYLKYGDRRRIAAELNIGDVVERHLDDGDVVLFNRQPSLHKMSIMAHRARVMPWRTFRFNECVCNPYNADFDGDEMNLHLPQTEEARAEAIHLMGVHANLATPKNGEVLIAANQDFLTSAFLITSKDVFVDRAQFAMLCSMMGDGMEAIDLPSPTVLKPIELWTGKQVFNVLVRPSACTRVLINTECAEKTYSKMGRTHMCPMDGYVAFHNSELISGQLGKATLGGGNKGGLFNVLKNDYSPKIAAVCMNRLAKLSARFIGDFGFSIGIDDVQPSSRLRREKARTLKRGYDACGEKIRMFKEGVLELQPGCNADQTLEAEVTGDLNKIREEAGKVCMDELHWHNSPLIMSRCGSKGSPINISQMVACVGQQTVFGSRIPNGFVDRTLPHFPKFGKAPDAKGFVANSFYTGLTPTEFFFHTMAGREGLVDTAVKTAETGYMSRRLMKALEDLSLQYDGTVRNSAQGIVQLVYGDDGLDPVEMEGSNSCPVDFPRMLLQVRAHYRRPSGARLPSPAALRAQAEALLAGPGYLDGEVTSSFREKVKGFMWKQIDRIAAARERAGIPPETSPSSAADQAREQLSMLSEGLTSEQLAHFFSLCARKYGSKEIEPGSAVGAVGAQSIGEPGTQMTLKTFHFAGVASMNITLGVPRIKEIINASKNISTPIIKVALDCDNDIKSARIVKGRIERTTLGEVARHIKAVFAPGECYVAVRLDSYTVENLQLDVNAWSVKDSIVAAPKLKLKDKHVRVVGPDQLMVFPPDNGKENGLYFALQSLRITLPKVIVKGIATVERAVINDLGMGKYNLLVEGTNLQAVMGTEGVAGAETTSNHVIEAEKTLGIEAARVTIKKEIEYTMGQHGMEIDERHSMLLADVMTYKGEVLGITRFGIAKMKDSVLMLASFEKTTDHLFDAAIHGRRDDVVGVSECIIMGIPMPVGTGIMKLR